MNFAEVERVVAKLRQDLAAGRLTEEQFKTRLREMMVQDERGDWWMVGYETGQWYRHDGTDWVPDQPPGHYAPQTVSPSPAQPVATARPKPRCLWAIVVFVLSEVITVIVGWAFALGLAFLFYDGGDNPLSWVCWGLFGFGGLVSSFFLARKAWRGNQVH